MPYLQQYTATSTQSHSFCI